MRKQTVWLLVILVGVFSAFLTLQSGHFLPFQKMLAQVGITVGVAPNPYNTLNDQLNQKQDQINQEAATLAAEQAALASSTPPVDAVSPVVWYLAVAVGVIAVLVVLNFYFDWRRGKREVHLVVPSEPEKPKE